MLEEIGVPYQTHIIEYGNFQSPEFKAVNPMAKVPTIVYGDQVISEAAAICAFLADTFPEAGLKPKPEYLGAYYRWLFFTSGPFESAINDHMLGVEVPEKFEVAVGYGNFERAVDVMESAISQDGYIAGPTFSAADVYIGSHLLYSLEMGVIEERPSFRRYVKRATDRPAFQRLISIEGPVLAKRVLEPKRPPNDIAQY